MYGEVLGYGSSMAARNGVAQIAEAVTNAARAALHHAGCGPDDVGHLHAHGLGTRFADREEAKAIHRVFETRGSEIPVVAAKSYFGNLGAAGGMVELIASLLAMQESRLFPVLGSDQPDPECGLRLVQGNTTPSGAIVLNLNFAPSGQASALVVRRGD